MNLEDILTGAAGVETIDTSKFILSVTNVKALRNIKLRSTIELMQLDSANASDEAFRNVYTMKQYELTFIDYLITLSNINLEQANNKSKTTEE